MVKVITTLGLVILSWGLGRFISKNKRYKLVKANKFTNFRILEKPDIYDTVRKKAYNTNITEEMQEIINKIYTSFEPIVSNESMQIIRRNIESIKVNSNWLKSIQLSFMGAGGSYSPLNHCMMENYFLTKLNINNYIESKKLFQKVISHELIHAASSFKSGRKMITGFCQYYIKPGGSNIGIGLNEGYTEVLSNRYIIDKKIVVNGKDVGYKYETPVAELVELIVGRDKMINMYFHGNLEGLTGELSKYQDKAKVKKFILDLDTIASIRRDRIAISKNNTVSNLYNRVNVFLYDAFTNKMSESSTEEYLKESRKFLELFSKVENNYPTNKKTKKEIKK